MSKTAIDFTCRSPEDLEEDPKGSTPLTGYENLKDSMGRFRTQSLFVEYKHDLYPAPFTLKDYDHRGSLSMYQKYMDYSDPTEYSVALGLLGSWKHWVLLTEKDWFKPYITEWRGELKRKLEYERFEEMEGEAKKGNLRATAWLDEKYGPAKKSQRGRPSKDEKRRYLKESAEETQLTKEEAERLGLN